MAQASLCDPGPPLTCATPATANPAIPFDPVLRPGDHFVIQIPVDISLGLDGATATNHVTVSGGGAPTVSASELTPVTAADAPFGFQDLAVSLTDAAGNPSTQAGSHPYQLNTYFLINTVSAETNPPAADLKDVRVKLPAGVVVNPKATPVRCTEAQLEANDGRNTFCPDASAAGYAHAIAGVFGSSNPGFPAAVFNMVPPPGVPAEFAFVTGVAHQPADQVGPHPAEPDHAELHWCVSCHGESQLPDFSDR